jgi:hypothetical protein
MITNQKPMFFKAAMLTVLLFGGFYTQLAYADVPDLSTMLENFAGSMPQFMQLVTASAYVMGIFFIYKSIIGLKQFGEQRSMMASSHELKGPLIMMAVGTCLLYLPSSVQAGMTTFWTDPNPYGYVTDAPDQWTTIWQDAIMVIQLIGTVAFIRGLLTLNQLSGQGQPGTFGKGLTYIIAGVLCINLNDFLTAVNSTLGITGVISNGTT